MAKEKKGFLVFLISTGISFVILGSIFTMYFVYSKTSNVGKNQENIPYISEYVPKKEESISVLVIGCEEIHLPPKMIMLFNYNAPHGIINTIAIPPNANATVGIREDTIAGHYDYEGIRGGANAVKNLLLTEVDRYVRLDKVGISNLVDFLGGIEYEVKKDITCGSEVFTKGKQLLDGRRVTALLFNQNQNHIVDTDMQSELITMLINQRFNKALAQKYSNFTSAFFYNAQTNLSQYDFEMRKKGLTGKMMLDSVVTKQIRLNGQYNSDFTQFSPSSKSIDDIIATINIKEDEE